MTGLFAISLRLFAISFGQFCRTVGKMCNPHPRWNPALGLKNHLNAGIVAKICLKQQNK